MLEVESNDVQNAGLEPLTKCIAELNIQQNVTSRRSKKCTQTRDVITRTWNKHVAIKDLGVRIQCFSTAL